MQDGRRARNWSPIQFQLDFAKKLLKDLFYFPIIDLTLQLQYTGQEWRDTTADSHKHEE